MGAFQNIIGQTFNYLTVIQQNPNKSNAGHYRWDCKCVCGNIVTHAASNLKSGTIHSCGCKFKSLLQDTHRTHGHSGTPEYNVWKSIKQRTTNVKNVDYPNYGGKGIKISDEWRSCFKTFISDMGPRPTDNHSVERRNNSGNYESSNCYWATPIQQANNKSSNIRYEFHGVFQTVSELARQNNVSYEALRRRLNKGQSPIDAISEMKNLT